MRRLALALLVLGGCLYGPAVPERAARCAGTADCPPGYGCYPAAGLATMVCCRTPRCGEPLPISGTADAGPEPDGALDPDAPPPAADAPASDAASPGDAAASDDLPAPPAADASAAPVTACRPRKGGPALVLVPHPSTPFCIDSTEVTNAQYETFLAATGNGSDVAGQAPFCSWNKSYLPDSNVGPVTIPGRDKRPVVGVDWCDAAAFCKWAGKRLCGKIGGGRLFTVGSAGDPGTGEWVGACAGRAGLSYPYGPTYQAHACNTDAPAEDQKYLEDVAHRPTCQGAIPGVFDLGGNVEEWVDACDADLGPDDMCASAGPATYTGVLSPLDFRCPDSIYGSPRAHPFKLRGFRCCSPP
jgi:sulfatase modifying factor 1